MHSMVLSFIATDQSQASSNSTIYIGRASGKSVHVEYNVEISEILSPEEFKSRNLKETELNEHCSSEWNVYISLTNGKIFGCDFVISATGVTPSGDNLKHVVDVADDGGILVDECLRTSAPDIYAAGKSE